jgi:hypothetical protein
VSATVTRYGWLKRLLDRPRSGPAVIGAALVLLATCLTSGITADDYVYQLVLSRSSAVKGFDQAPLDMYKFVADGSAGLLMQEGVLSWWADPEARLAFMRPLSAATHYLDHRLWPDSPLLMHLHCLFWGLLVFLALHALYRDLLSPAWVAALALFLYALDDSRCWFGSFVAARNATVATAVSIWVLVFYHRYRELNFRPGAWLAPLFLALALLCGEGSLSICGYLFAYALFLDTGTWPRRLLRLAPYALIVLIWRIVYRALGYGVQGSGLYVDPLQDPWRFSLKFLERAPILIFAQWGGFWSDLRDALFVFPRVSQLIMATAVIFVLLMGVFFYPLVRRDRLVCFALLGAALSLLPASATFNSDRMLSWVAIGASIALARFLSLYMQDPALLGLSPLLSRLSPAVVLALVVTNIIVAPLLLPSRAHGGNALVEILDRADAGVPKDPAITGKKVVFFNTPAVPLAGYIPVMRAVKGEPRPRSQVWLATSTTELTVQRVDAHTLRVRPDGGFLINPGDLLLRSPRDPLKRGQRIVLGDTVIQVEEMTSDRRPAQILARFSQPLDGPDLYFVCWEEIGFIPCKPPGIGGRLRLPSADYFKVTFGTTLPFSARFNSDKEGAPETIEAGDDSSP